MKFQTAVAEFANILTVSAVALQKLGGKDRAANAQKNERLLEETKDLAERLRIISVEMGREG